MKKVDVSGDISNYQLEKEFRRTARKRRRWTSFKCTFSMLIVFAAILVLISTLWFPIYHITGIAMEPSLKQGTVVVATRLGNLEAGDIAAIYYKNHILISRLIGMPGDSVYIDEQGIVSVNNLLLEEDYLTETVLGTTDLTYPYLVPEGRYFVMGDNRAKSTDSRMSDIGCVEEESFAGRILFCIWPLRQIGYVG